MEYITGQPLPLESTPTRLPGSRIQSDVVPSWKTTAYNTIELLPCEIRHQTLLKSGSEINKTSNDGK